MISNVRFPNQNGRSKTYYSMTAHGRFLPSMNFNAPPILTEPQISALPLKADEFAFFLVRLKTIQTQ